MKYVLDTHAIIWYLGNSPNLGIRLSFGDNLPTGMSGSVKADETYVGGREKNKHASKRTAGTQGRNMKAKAAVFGLLQRGDGTTVSQANAMVVASTSGPELKSRVRRHVQAGSEIYDTLKSKPSASTSAPEVMRADS